MKRLVWWLLIVPIGVIAVAFAVSNRRSVLVSLDPFRPESPVLGLTLPLYVVIFATFIAGLVVGGLVVWWTQGRFRRACRAAEGEAQRWRQEATRADERLKAAGLVSAVPGLPAPTSRAA